MADVLFYSLEADLYACGIPCLDIARVRKHKRDMLDGLRPGMWRYFYVLPCTMVRIVNVSFDTYLWLSFVSMVAGIAASMTFMRPTSIDSGAYLVCALVGLSLPTLAYLTTLLVALVLKTVNRDWFEYEFEPSGAYWKRTRYIPARVDWLAAAPNMPSHICRRAECAEQIDGTRLYVEYLQEDPFLVACRGRWPLREETYIGAWNTGTNLDTT